MTLPTFAPGINWQAIILAALNLQCAPAMAEKTTQDAGFNMALTPRIGMLPPALLNMILAPTIGMGRGADADLNMSLTPQLRWFPSTALNLAATPTVGVGGSGISTASLTLSRTPSVGLTGVRNVLFDAVGAGSTGTGASKTISWAHTIGGSAVIAAANFGASVSGATATAKVGTTSMTPLFSPLLMSTASGLWFWLCMWGLITPPTGSQTVSVVASGGTDFLAANSVSYYNVSGFATPTTATGTGTSMAVTDPSSSHSQRVVCAFAAVDTSTGNISAFNKTSRSNIALVSGTADPLVIGDAAGASTVAFSATAPANSGWGGAAVGLLP